MYTSRCYRALSVMIHLCCEMRAIDVNAIFFRTLWQFSSKHKFHLFRYQTHSKFCILNYPHSLFRCLFRDARTQTIFFFASKITTISTMSECVCVPSAREHTFHLNNHCVFHRLPSFSVWIWYVSVCVFSSFLRSFFFISTSQQLSFLALQPLIPLNNFKVPCKSHLSIALRE